MAVPRPFVALVTDFGIDDPYVGIMKGVMLSICPDIKFIDVCHQIAPQDVRSAARALAQSHSYFPENTILMAVVDPGVGTDRRIVAVETKKHMFLAPDNGVLSFLQPDEILQVRNVTNTDFFLNPVSQTFHGRDVFAPVAGFVSNGTRIEQLGEAIDDIVRFESRRPTITDQRIEGQVVAEDGFGNLITNVRREDLKGWDLTEARVQLGDLEIEEISSTFGNVPEGMWVAYVGSGGYLELGVNCGNGVQALGLDAYPALVIESTHGETVTS